MPTELFPEMVLPVMVGKALFMQYIPLPLSPNPVAPVILNPEMLVPVPSKVTVFVFPNSAAVIVGVPTPRTAILLLI